MNWSITNFFLTQRIFFQRYILFSNAREIYVWELSIMWYMTNSRLFVNYNRFNVSFFAALSLVWSCNNLVSVINSLLPHCCVGINWYEHTMKYTCTTLKFLGSRYNEKHTQEITHRHDRFHPIGNYVSISGRLKYVYCSYVIFCFYCLCFSLCLNPRDKK